MSGIYLRAIKRIFLNLSGGTVTGDTVFTEGVYASRLSGDTIFSAGTNLETIIRNLSISSEDITRVQPGTNIITGGTVNFPTINLADDISLNSVSASNVSGSTFFSAGTNLETVVRNLVSSSTHTYVQPGSNIITGGTPTFPVINVTDNPIFTSISASTVSADTIYVGGVPVTDNYTTASTLVGNIVFFDRNDQLSAYTLDLSSIAPTGGTDYYVTGGTFFKATNTLTLDRNDGVSVNITGITDYYTTAATLYNNVLYFDRVDQLSAYTVDLSVLAPTGGTDNYTTAATLVGDVVYFDRTDQASAYTLSLSGFSTTDIYATGATYSKASGELTISRNDGGTIVASGITDYYTTASTLVGNTIFFDRIDQASAYTVDLSSLVVSGVTDYYVTGGTFIKSASTLTLSRNDGFDVIVTGLTDFYTTAATLYNNVLYFDTTSQLSAYTVDLSTLAPTGTTTDYYTTAATIVGTTVYFDRNDLLSAYTLDLSSLLSSGNTYLSSVSVSNYNTLLQRNDAVDVVMSGTSTVFFPTEPDASVYSGNTWIRTTDFNMFTYSTVFNRWVGINSNRISGVRGKANQSDLFLRYEDNTPYNLLPYRGTGNYVIASVLASGSNSGDTWQARILTGTTVSTDTIYTLDMVSTYYNLDDNVNIEVLSGTPIYLYMSGSSVDYPKIEVYIKES